MTKKGTIRKTSVTSSRLHTRRQVSADARRRLGPQGEAAIASVPSAPAGSSETEALNFLLSSITDKLGDQGVEKAQMHQFLSLILETDPALKEEILRGICFSK
ncbi:MAG: hypothetical protein RIS36_1745 [Pseudomonadota bacterium]|jgi:hypothetical protein